MLTASSGMRIEPDATLETASDDIDTLLVAGGPTLWKQAPDEGSRHPLKRVAALAGLAIPTTCGAPFCVVSEWRLRTIGAASSARRDRVICTGFAQALHRISRGLSTGLSTGTSGIARPCDARCRTFRPRRARDCGECMAPMAVKMPAGERRVRGGAPPGA